MKDNVQNKGELDLLDLLKMLFAKWKTILCVALIAAIIGGALGAAITLLGKRNFGTQVEFYITPSSPDSHILHLLSSERFAEKLLLDENGLPENAQGEDYDAALEAKRAYDEANKKLAEAKKASKEASRELAVAQKTYEEKQKTYEDAYNLLAVYKGASDIEAGTDKHKAKIAEYESAVSETKAEKESAEKAYYEASQKVLEINHSLEAAKENSTNAKKTADELSEKILTVWRNQDGNKEKISRINESITYNYIDVEQTQSEGADQQNVRQFLVAEISVQKDEELAKSLLANMCEKLPAYVEENSIDTETVEETECILISTAAEIENLAKNSLAKDIIKFALIALVAALAITCILVIWIGVKAQETKRRDEYAENGDINAPLV